MAFTQAEIWWTITGSTIVDRTSLKVNLTPIVFWHFGLSYSGSKSPNAPAQDARTTLMMRFGYLPFIRWVHSTRVRGPEEFSSHVWGWNIYFVILGWISKIWISRIANLILNETKNYWILESTCWSGAMISSLNTSLSFWKICIGENRRQQVEKNRPLVGISCITDSGWKLRKLRK